MKVLVFDTETTGLLLPSAAPLDKQPRIIELGIAVLLDGQTIEEHNWLIDPGEPISAEITKITGITNEQLTGKPSFKDVWSEAQGLFLSADAVIAHNLPFDKGMIDNEVQRLMGEPLGCGWPEVQLCTVQEFSHVFGHRPKLTELYEHFLGRPLMQTHRALDDVHALVEIVKASGLLGAL